MTVIISWADHKDRTVWVHLYITTSLHRTLLPVAWLVVWLRVPVDSPSTMTGKYLLPSSFFGPLGKLRVMSWTIEQITCNVMDYWT